MSETRSLTEAQIEDLLTTASIGVLCTAGADGRPHGSPVWFDYQGDAVRVLIDGSSRKARDIAGNRQVVLVVDTRKPPYRGVILNGEAHLSAPDPGLRRRLARRYLGEVAGRAYVKRTLRMDETDRLVTIRITRRFSWDYSNEP